MKGNAANRNELDSDFRHSTHYHKYFQGYTEIKVLQPNGKYKIERFYTAPWKQHALEDNQRRKVKAQYLLLTVAGIFVYVMALMMAVSSNFTRIAAIPGMATVVGLILSAATAVSYAAKPVRMTLWDYKSSSPKIQTVTKWTAIGVDVTMAAKLVSTLIYGTQSIAGEIFSQLLLAGAAGTFLWIHATEKDMEYENVPNDTVLPQEGGNEIW